MNSQLAKQVIEQQRAINAKGGKDLLMPKHPKVTGWLVFDSTGKEHVNVVKVVDADAGVIQQYVTHNGLLLVNPDTDEPLTEDNKVPAPVTVLDLSDPCRLPPKQWKFKGCTCKEWVHSGCPLWDTAHARERQRSLERVAAEKATNDAREERMRKNRLEDWRMVTIDRLRKEVDRLRKEADQLVTEVAAIEGTVANLRRVNFWLTVFLCLSFASWLLAVVVQFVWR